MAGDFVISIISEMASTFNKGIDNGNYEEKIIYMNGEIVLTIKGKMIRLDALRDTNGAFINIDGQIKTNDFPFKRHVLYASVNICMLRQNVPTKEIARELNVPLYQVEDLRVALFAVTS